MRQRPFQSLMKVWLAPLAALALAACASVAPPKPQPLLVLVSIDGFRADYLDRGLTPTLSRLAGEGVRGAMRPSFPSNTFPNHYTLVTGLRPDRHGIVDNVMEDPAIPGVVFTQRNTAAVQDPVWWSQGEPVWVTAERAGLPTAPLNWPGSEAPVGGARATHWAVFDPAVSGEARVDRMLALLDQLSPPRFATVYFDLIDTVGHQSGPDSPQLNAALARVDADIARLVAGLSRRGLARTTHLIIVADHGMTAISQERVIFLDDLSPADSFRVIADGSRAALAPLKGREDEAEAGLVGPHAHAECWRKEALPEAFHYGRNARVPPIFCLAEPGWTLTTRAAGKKVSGGAHGYDPANPDMAGLFIAVGPDLPQGKEIAMFDNVDVYPLLIRLLGLKPQPHDGHDGGPPGLTTSGRP